MRPLRCTWMPGLAGLALLLAGCEKDTSGPTRVSGQVVEANSRQAVARPPQVQVWGLTRGSGGSYTPVGDPQPTDGQGNFSFSFPADAGRSYVLRATGGLGYYTDWGLAPALQGGQKNAGVQVPVYAPAWVRVDLVDEPPPQPRVDLRAGIRGGGRHICHAPRHRRGAEPLCLGSVHPDMAHHEQPRGRDPLRAPYHRYPPRHPAGAYCLLTHLTF